MNAVASPCINVCRMDETSGLCAGCFRDIAEIAGWSGFSDAERLQVLARIDKRRAEWAPDGAQLRGECER
jgi:predicted Fe-S protein YdhL (DUF1289 family)